MKIKIAMAALTVPLLALTACGSDDGPTDERNRAGAIATLVAFSHDIGAEDYTAACDRIEDQMRTDTCEDSLKRLRGESEPEHPGRFGDLSDAEVKVEYFAQSGCAYKMAQDTRSGDDFLPFGSAILVYHDDQWWVSSIGNLEDYAGDTLGAEDVEAYPCDDE